MSDAPGNPKACLSCLRPHGSWTCERCGQPHPKCTGHNRAGEPCGRKQSPGQCTCTNHGAASPQARAAAGHRMERAEAERAVATLGLRRDTTPADALLEEVQWTAGHVAWLREQVQGLHPAPTHNLTDLRDGSDMGMGSRDGKGSLVWGVTKIKTGGEDGGTTQEAKPSVWYQLYQEERRHLVTVCAAALKAGVEERRVQIAERTGELLAQAVRGILADLSLSETQQALVGEVVPRHLRALAGGSAA